MASNVLSPEIFVYSRSAIEAVKPHEVLMDVNYFCRLATTILAGCLQVRGRSLVSGRGSKGIVVG